MDIKNNYDKINLLYANQRGTYGDYMYFKGPEVALKRNGLLYYAYEVTGKEPLNINKLLKYPILCYFGSWEPVFSIVKLIAGRQFIAEINSESLFPLIYNRSEKFLYFKYLNKERIAKIKNLPISDYPKLFTKLFNKIFKEKRFRLSDYYETLKEREKYFNLYFSPVEGDLSKYFGKPCYWFPSWVNVELLDDIAEPISDKIGFIGRITANRLGFFNQDKNKIIEIANTISIKDDPIRDVKELGRLINKYRYLICPTGSRVRTFPGKVFEYMACKRLCFCYLNEEQMFKSRLLFEDGKEIVYFKTFPELEEKYRYYLKNPEEVRQIAQAGYEKVRKYHNADIRTKWFAEVVLHHANGGKYYESYNDIFIKNI